MASTQNVPLKSSWSHSQDAIRQAAFLDACLYCANDDCTGCICTRCVHEGCKGCSGVQPVVCCSHTFQTISDLAQHYAESHAQENRFPECCNQTFESPHHMIQHCAEVHPEFEYPNAFQCCGQTVLITNAVQHYNESHTKQTTWEMFNPNYMIDERQFNLSPRLEFEGKWGTLRDPPDSPFLGTEEEDNNEYFARGTHSNPPGYPVPTPDEAPESDVELEAAVDVENNDEDHRDVEYQPRPAKRKRDTQTENAHQNDCAQAPPKKPKTKIQEEQERKDRELAQKVFSQDKEIRNPRRAAAPKFNNTIAKYNRPKISQTRKRAPAKSNLEPRAEVVFPESVAQVKSSAGIVPQGLSRPSDHSHKRKRDSSDGNEFQPPLSKKTKAKVTNGSDDVAQTKMPFKTARGATTPSSASGQPKRGQTPETESTDSDSDSDSDEYQLPPAKHTKKTKTKVNNGSNDSEDGARTKRSSRKAGKANPTPECQEKRDRKLKAALKKETVTQPKPTEHLPVRDDDHMHPSVWVHDKRNPENSHWATTDWTLREGRYLDLLYRARREFERQNNYKEIKDGNLWEYVRLQYKKYKEEYLGKDYVDRATWGCKTYFNRYGKVVFGYGEATSLQKKNTKTKKKRNDD